MQLFTIAILSVVFAAVQAAAKTPPTTLQIGIKHRNPDPNCIKAKVGDTLMVHYTGKLWETGEEFDSSWSRNDPFMFTIGRAQVIQGWERGMVGMCEGEKRKLLIPAKDGYGEKGAGELIPPNAALVFETELISINDKPTYEAPHADLRIEL